MLDKTCKAANARKKICSRCLHSEYTAWITVVNMQLASNFIGYINVT